MHRLTFKGQELVNKFDKTCQKLLEFVAGICGRKFWFKEFQENSEFMIFLEIFIYNIPSIVVL